MSGVKEAFRASGLSELIAPPKNEAAMLANPLEFLPLPISGERITLTVYCLGMLRAILIPTTNPTAAAL